jgi:hypothetical protein
MGAPTTKKRGPYKLPTIFPLSPELQRRQKIRVRDAARLNCMSEDTFRKEHSDLIRKLSDRVEGVELGDAIDLGQPKEA